MRVGKRLAPIRPQLKKIEAMVYAGATPEGISEVLRIHLPACQNWHKTYTEKAKKLGIEISTSPEQTVADAAKQKALKDAERVTGAKEGMPPGIGTDAIKPMED